MNDGDCDNWMAEPELSAMNNNVEAGAAAAAVQDTDKHTVIVHSQHYQVSRNKYIRK